MNTAHALGFFALGLVMLLIPVVAPGSFPGHGPDGSNAQALWLAVMGGVQLAIGLMWAGQLAVSRFADDLATFALPVLDRSTLVPVDLVESAK
jgi:phosphate/sulfate permease